MDNDSIVEETIELTGETKNCYVFEPDVGSEIVCKIYVRKSAFASKPESITVQIAANG